MWRFAGFCLIFSWNYFSGWLRDKYGDKDSLEEIALLWPLTSFMELRGFYLSFSFLSLELRDHKFLWPKGKRCVLCGGFLQLEPLMSLNDVVCLRLFKVNACDIKDTYQSPVSSVCVRCWRCEGLFVCVFQVRIPTSTTDPKSLKSHRRYETFFLRLE